MALAVFAIRFFGGETAVRQAEWWIGDAALASVFALPGLVGLGGRRDVFLAAGIASVAFGLTLVSIVTLPLVVPGVLFLIAFGREPERERGHPGRATAVLLVTGWGALALLLFTPFMLVCWTKTEYRDGRVVVERDREAERRARSGFFSQTSKPPSRDVVSDEGGCTEGAIPPSRSIAALVLVGAGALVSRKLV